jgi:hypothetical protein
VEAVIHPDYERAMEAARRHFVEQYPKGEAGRSLVATTKDGSGMLDKESDRLVTG